MGFWGKVGRVVTYPVRKPKEKAKEYIEMKVIGSIIRHTLTFGGGALFGTDWISDSQLDSVVNGASVLIGVLWAIYRSRKEAALEKKAVDKGIKP